MKVELLNYTKDADKLIAQSAKLCYSSSSIEDILGEMSEEDIRGFNEHLMEIGHESPIEHASFTFGVEGVSRITETQLVRHRIASYSIQSSRYVKRSNMKVVKPENIKKSVFNNEYDRVIEKIEDLYTEMIAAGIKKEDARYILPQGMETKIIVTMNLRTLMHFLNLRTCMRAQWEIREMANLMLEKCKEVYPELFKYAGPSCLKIDCPEGEMSCGQQKRMREIYLK